MSVNTITSGDVTISIQGTTQTLSCEVETKRLKILSVTDDKYLAQFIDLYGNKEVNKLVGSGTTLTADQVIAKIERWKKRWSEKNPFSGFAIVEKETGNFVGQIILKPVKDGASNCVLKKFMTYTGRKDRYGGPREWYERKYS